VEFFPRPSPLAPRPFEAANAAHLGIADLSFLTRFGVKGASAPGWLLSQGIPVPDRPNTWCPLPKGGIVARLGLTEFLIEDLHSAVAPQLAKACQQPPAKIYPVLRQDAAITLCGAAVNELLLQTCNINFQALSLAERPVVLTTIVGVATIIIPGQRNGQSFYRLWCDGTFGAYMWRTLLAIAQELGGGAVGARLVL
jgi:sarcosine oxidase subunit gamma